MAAHANKGMISWSGKLHDCFDPHKDNFTQLISTDSKKKVQNNIHELYSTSFFAPSQACDVIPDFTDVLVNGKISKVLVQAFFLYW